MALEARAGPARILVVEDEPNILISLDFLLKNAGYEVMISRDGKHALETAWSWHPDLVLLDIMLPLVNGFEVCRHLRESAEFRQLKILVLTARGREREFEKGLAVGANAYLTKPFATRELMRTIASLLAPARASD